MKKRVAVIGYGGQGKWHTWFILDSDVVSLTGVYDINEERRQEARDNGLFVYNSNEEIFADGTVDIIVVATPNDVHEQLCIQALNSGHNVICEKPVTLSVKSFDRMISAAHNNNKVFSVHQNRRWDKEYLGIKEIVDSGELGDIFRIENRVQGSRGIPGDWRKEKKYGGGMMYDWGVHLIDQVISIFPQKIIEVNCDLTNLTNTEVDDGFRLELLFAGGLTAFIEVSTYNFLRLPRFYMQCERGTAVIDDWNSSIRINKLIRWMDKEIKPVQTSSGISKTMAPRDHFSCEEYEKELPDANVHDFYRNFCHTIDGKCEQSIKNEQVRRVLLVIEKAFDSSKNRCRIKTDI